MPHASAAGQFRIMTQYGMSSMEAIRSATLNAAQALGREKDVGAIAVGRYGDIIAVGGDPLANIRELEDVDVVIKGGKVEKNKP
jgi:imidazolonepropionase-like amidohydrolase